MARFDPGSAAYSARIGGFLPGARPELPEQRLPHMSLDVLNYVVGAEISRRYLEPSGRMKLRFQILRSKAVVGIGFPPRPKGTLIGSKFAEYKRDTLGFFHRTSVEYGDLGPMRFGPIRAVFLNHPDTIA